ncbi:DoxX family protein [Kordiimonas sp.]|uniref:DoxX family protein n=1 Tax=Kordiimonas sp. TaxID=1970157 RepID=UPI003A9191BB
MNIVLWVLGVLLALHTAVGAAWKFTNSEQSVPSLNVIPHGMWMAMSGVEILCAIGLVVPAFYKPLAFLVPLAAVLIAIEMLAFCVLHLVSGDSTMGPMVYWLVVAAICAFIAYGRYALTPFS